MTVEAMVELCRYTERDGALICARDAGHAPPHVLWWASGRAKANVDRLRGLLERVVDDVDDPWFHEAYEGFNDGCVFCGCSDSDWKQLPETYLHEPTCVWFDIHAELGRDVDAMHRRKP